MDFPFGQTVYRHRYPTIPDPYNPARQVIDISGNPTTIPLAGAFISSSSSVAVSDATRSQILTAKSLYLTDVTVDVQVGDRIGTAPAASAAEFFVEALTFADTNPFTGWQPVREIPLEQVTG